MRIRKNFLIPILFIFILFFPSLILAQSQSAERIISFQSNIKINSDDTLTITENIKVVANGQQIRHGIYRDIPLRFTDRFGNAYDDVLDIKEVLKDGQVEDNRLEDLNNGQRLYIGNSDVLLAPGIYTYTIVYGIGQHISFLNNQDKISWNVTGDNWNFNIDKVVATVQLPDGAIGEAMSLIAYTGASGGEGKDSHISKDIKGNIVFETLRTLRPSEGFIISVSWPRGFIKEPSILESHIGVATAFGSMIFLVLYYMVVWLLVAQAPKKGRITPKFNPPEGISPAMARYLMQMDFDNKVFTVAVYDMAVKGYLKIDEEVKTPPLSNIYTLTRTNGSANLTVEERALGQELFKESHNVQLKNENFGIIGSAREALHDELKKDLERIYFNAHKGFFLAGLIITGLLVFGLIDVADVTKSSRFDLLLILIICVMLGLINKFFHYLLRAPTLKGRLVMDDIEDFKSYLSEKSSYLKFSETQKGEAISLGVNMPYILAFDLEHKWDEFSSMLQKAGQPLHVYHGFYYYNFSSDFNHMLGASSMPFGGGRSGGGGSSGGFGGGFGGGGGW